ncbi:hypothetical protein [Tsukamurella pulmonis]|uniref:hypothetical protein n=1 Tax=Tsukamurella pulmonis TaxID=47312 RepID=UPI0011146992|nr:hypothetical protein [Tsukamurella pulmonis]
MSRSNSPGNRCRPLTGCRTLAAAACAKREPAEAIWRKSTNDPRCAARRAARGSGELSIMSIKSIILEIESMAICRVSELASADDAREGIKPGRLN